jgi:uncharacterized membrane protein
MTEQTSGVPLLGFGVAAVIAGFFLISQGIGLRARRGIIPAKVALAAMAIAVTVSGAGPAAATVAVAAGWVALVLLEVAVRDRSPGLG